MPGNKRLAALDSAECWLRILTNERAWYFSWHHLDVLTQKPRRYWLFVAY
jgi:hypothetical protein